MHESQDLQFKIDSERQIFEKHFHGNFVDSHRYRRRNIISYLVLLEMSDLYRLRLKIFLVIRAFSWSKGNNNSRSIRVLESLLRKYNSETSLIPLKKQLEPVSNRIRTDSEIFTKQLHS